MSYKEGITINGKHSYVDFDLTISSRKIDLPPKNSIRKTVPYMSGFYDFTTLNGAATFGEREISYTFDIVGDTVEAMDRKRTEVVNWFCNLHDVDIYDDTIPDYHFHGSYESQSQNEDGEKTELTITFVCHPFLIKNEPTQMVFNTQRADTIYYDGQPVVLYGKGKATIKTGGYASSLDSAEMIDTGLVLTAGNRQIEVIPTDLLLYPYKEKTKTTNGITFTDNGDGTITANGTATATAYFELQTVQLEVGQYYLKGCPIVANLDGLRVVADEIGGNTKRYGQDIGRGSAFSVDKNLSVGVFIAVDTGRTLTNVKFDPSLVKVTTLEYSEEVL
jgi:hypothetical protein